MQQFLGKINKRMKTESIISKLVEEIIVMMKNYSSAVIKKKYVTWKTENIKHDDKQI